MTSNKAASVDSYIVYHSVVTLTNELNYCNIISFVIFLGILIKKGSYVRNSFCVCLKAFDSMFFNKFVSLIVYELGAFFRDPVIRESLTYYN